MNKSNSNSSMGKNNKCNSKFHSKNKVNRKMLPILEKDNGKRLNLNSVNKSINYKNGLSPSL